MGARRNRQILVLSRRLPPGSRLRLYFRAPERTDSRRENHFRTTCCFDFSAPGTKIQTISVLALALESVGEDSSPTLSWPHFFGMWLMASFFGLVRASAKILRPRSHGLNFWPPESVGEDFFIDGVVALPSPSVVLCSRASPLLICELQGLSSGWISEPQRGPTVAEFVTGSVQLKSKLMLGASVE